MRPNGIKNEESCKIRVKSISQLVPNTKSSGSRAETFWPFHPSHLVLGTMEAFTTKEHVVQAKIIIEPSFSILNPDERY